MLSRQDSFRSTKIPLGSGRAYIVPLKAKFSAPTGYCISGCGLVQFIINNKSQAECPICHSKVRKTQSTWASVIKRFQVIIDHNKPYLDEILFSRKENQTLKIPVKIQKLTYLVPVRYFKEFENMDGADYDDQLYDKFFRHIMRYCFSFSD